MKEEKLDAALDEYEEWRERLHRLMTDNEEVFNEFWELLGGYNTALKKVRAILGEIEPESKSYRRRGFRVTKSKRFFYDPGALPAEVLAMTIEVDGETKRVAPRVTTSVIDTLIADGQIDGRSVASAKTVTESRSIYGPKPVEFKL